MEVNLKDLMDRSEITTDDLDYIVYRLWKDGVNCYELTHAFIDAYYTARCKIDDECGDDHHYSSEVEVAGDIAKWVDSFVDNKTDKFYP